MNPLFNPVCETTIRNDCIRTFEEQKLALHEVLKSANSRVSLTAVMWISNETVAYMCATCHFIDTDWKTQRRIIKLVVVDTPHNGVEMFNGVLKCIQDWNVEDKLFGITLDKTAANDTMVDMLKHNMVKRKVLPVKGKLFHNRCSAHVINHMVKDGLKFFDPVIDNIREGVRSILSSEPIKDKFQEIIAEKGITCEKRPFLDLPTHWNSTYFMLQIALKFRRAFDSMALQDANYTYSPSFEEWERLEVLCRLLKVFYEATLVISSPSIPTSNLYFHEMWKIKLTLDREKLLKLVLVPEIWSDG